MQYIKQILSILLIVTLAACNNQNDKTVSKAEINSKTALAANEPSLDEFRKVKVQESTPEKKETKAAHTPEKVVEKHETKKVVKKATKPVEPKKQSAKPVRSNVQPAVVNHMPRIVFEKPVHQFGEIVEGDIVEHRFKFKNNGKADLEITGAEASCGCTRPSFPFVAIAPGEEGFIGVTYNSVTKDGPQKPEIKVYSNVSKEPMVLYLEGVVVPESKEEANAEVSDSMGDKI